jgi:hypothetical protein
MRHFVENLVDPVRFTTLFYYSDSPEPDIHLSPLLNRILITYISLTALTRINISLTSFLSAP